MAVTKYVSFWDTLSMILLLAVVCVSTANSTSFMAVLLDCNLTHTLAPYNIPTSRVTIHSTVLRDNTAACNLNFTFRDDASTCTNNCQPVDNDYSLVPTATLTTLFLNMPVTAMSVRPFLAASQLWSSNTSPNGDPIGVTNLDAAKFKVVPKVGMGEGYAGAIRVQLKPDTMWGSVDSEGTWINEVQIAMQICKRAFWWVNDDFPQAKLFRRAGFDTGFVALSGLTVQNDTLQATDFNSLFSQNNVNYQYRHTSDLGVICQNDTFTTVDPTKQNDRITYTCVNTYSDPQACDYGVFGYAFKTLQFLSPNVVVGSSNSTHSAFYISGPIGNFTKLDVDGVIQSMAPYYNFTWDIDVKLKGREPEPSTTTTTTTTSSTTPPGNAPGNADEDDDVAGTTTLIVIVVVVAAVALIGIGGALYVLKRRSSGGMKIHEVDCEMSTNNGPSQPLHDDEL